MVDFPRSRREQLLAKLASEMALRENRINRDVNQYVHRYQSALASGKFSRAKRLLERSTEMMSIRKGRHAKLITPVDIGEVKFDALGNPSIEPTGNPVPALSKRSLDNPLSRFNRYLTKKVHLIKFLNEVLKAGGENINSPLLDLFGPIQMNEAMRKSSPRRKYLMREGDGGA